MTRPWTQAQRAAGPGRGRPITLPAARLDITEPKLANDITEPSPTNDMADPTPSALPRPHTERALPTDPTEPTLPTDPIDSTDPRLAMLRIESSDAMDHFDDMSAVSHPVATDLRQQVGCTLPDDHARSLRMATDDARHD